MVEFGEGKEAARTFYKNLLANNTVINKLSCEEAIARLELELGLFEEAKTSFYELLLKRNAENYDYHRGFQVRFSAQCHKSLQCIARFL